MPSLPFHSDLRRSCQVCGRLLLDQIGVVGLNETIEVERYPLMVCRHGLCVQTGNGRRFDLLQDIFRPHRLEAGGIHHEDVGFDPIDFAFRDHALKDDIGRCAPDFHFEAEALLEGCDEGRAVAVGHGSVQRQFAFLLGAFLQSLLAVRVLIGGGIDDRARLRMAVARCRREHCDGECKSKRNRPRRELELLGEHCTLNVWLRSWLRRTLSAGKFPCKQLAWWPYSRIFFVRVWCSRERRGLNRSEAKE